MKKYNIIIAFFCKFFSFLSSRINLIKTFYINFRLFDFRTAIKFPILAYGSCNFRCLSGEVEIKGNIWKGMIKLGLNNAGFVSTSPTYINLLKGSKIIFNGSAMLSQGVGVTVTKDAVLDLGADILVGDSVKIICTNHIKIGYSTQITWECQLMDFNTHYTADLDNKIIKSIKAPIIIGQYCWICNRTTIMPGTILPDKVIVASNSLLNKNYINKGISPYCLIGGMPASLIKRNVARVFDLKYEMFLNKYFCDNSKMQYYNFDNIHI